MELRRPPDLPAVPPVNPLARLLPLVMLVAVGGMVAVYLTSAQSAARNPIFLLFPVMMLASAMGTLAHTFRGRTGEIDAGAPRLPSVSRRSGRRRHGDGTPATSGVALDPPGSGRVVDDGRWGAHVGTPPPGDPDFGVIRVGLGAVALSTPLIAPPAGTDDETDPVTVGALKDALDRCALLDDVPVTLRLADCPPGAIGMDRASARNLLRAMVCQLAMLHSPRDVRIAAVVPVGDGHWDWLKWLPHHRDREVVDAAGPRRLTFPRSRCSTGSLPGAACRPGGDRGGRRGRTGNRGRCRCHGDRALRRRGPRAFRPDAARMESVWPRR